MILQNMHCETFQHALPDLLLDPASPTGVAAQAHLESCAACRREFASFRATFTLLDTWEAPEPSPYFDRKLAARLRDAATNPPAGWFERLREHLLFNTGRQFRPALAGAMALVLLLGGGTLVGVTHLSPNASQAQVSPAVGDLQILDKNDQAMQQMDQLLDDNGTDDTSAQPFS